MTLRNVAPDRTLLDVLREDLGLTGIKNGCGEVFTLGVWNLEHREPGLRDKKFQRLSAQQRVAGLIERWRPHAQG